MNPCGADISEAVKDWNLLLYDLEWTVEFSSSFIPGIQQHWGKWINQNQISFLENFRWLG
jgi:hypothetical protein